VTTGPRWIIHLPTTLTSRDAAVELATALRRSLGHVDVLDSREALILSGYPNFAATGRPIPVEIVWTHLVDVLRRHRVVGGVCQACGERAGREGRCFKGAVAAQWCQENQMPLSDQPASDAT